MCGRAQRLRGGVRRGGSGCGHGAAGDRRRIPRTQSRRARARLAQAITAQVTETLGRLPTRSKSFRQMRSQKLQRKIAARRDEAAISFRQTAFRRALPRGCRSRDSRRHPARGACAQRLQRGAEIVYGIYAIAMFALLLLPAWLFVLLSPSRKNSARVTTAALRAYLKVAGWRVRVEGRENLRENKARMFVANHTSYADIVVLMAALGTDYHFVAKAEVMSMPFFGTFLRKLGHFSFRREDPRCAIATGGTSRGRVAARRIRFYFSGRHVQRTIRRAAISSRRVQSGHRGAAGNRAHRARGNAPRAARRRVFAAPRTHHHYDLSADLAAALRPKIGNKSCGCATRCAKQSPVSRTNLSYKFLFSRATAAQK